MRFKKGDHVIYIGRNSPWLKGVKGIVKQYRKSDSVEVRWKNGETRTIGVYPHNLQLDEAATVSGIIHKYEV
jgi:NADPH:quinone reductase-like Zn-dependent oxidoreductase